MKFISRRDPLFITIFLIIFIIFNWIIYRILLKGEFKTEQIISLCVVISAFIFIAWSIKATQYEITGHHIKYKSGVIRGSININNIRSITTNKTLWVGVKPAMARNGLIIKYNKYDEIYISPKTNKTFINEILKLNSNLIIIHNK